jgi:hypothetical protein
MSSDAYWGGVAWYIRLDVGSCDVILREGAREEM